ncbi:MAG: hypothetical protein PHU86_03905 [Patescibacteria group bacterium]|nr:hypothetical protein [Patescibacteria group bacterium]
MVLSFTYSKEKDLENYKNNFLNSKYPDYGRDEQKLKQSMASFLVPSFVKKISDKNISEEQRIIDIKAYLEKFESKNRLFIDKNLGSIKAIWEDREKEYLKKLENYFGEKLPFEKIDVYYTTLTICPYNKKDSYFYITLWSNLATQITSICHETMHLYFLHNFADYCHKKGLSTQDILDLNEALTVTLNFIFFEILIVPEQNNKPSTFALQTHIASLCREKKDFKYILESSIEFIKKNR